MRGRVSKIGAGKVHQSFQKSLARGHAAPVVQFLQIDRGMPLQFVEKPLRGFEVPGGVLLAAHLNRHRPKPAARMARRSEAHTEKRLLARIVSAQEASPGRKKHTLRADAELVRECGNSGAAASGKHASARGESLGTAAVRVMGSFLFLTKLHSVHEPGRTIPSRRADRRAWNTSDSARWGQARPTVWFMGSKA